MPNGHDAEQFRDTVRRRFDLSLAMGLGKTNGTVFRIGHLGFTNDATILGAVAAIEIALSYYKVPHTPQGIEAAVRYLKEKPNKEAEEKQTGPELVPQ
jgi:alanine-glyoxylate transaminase/serine-glyoxylate transaminase/serine-pyruvate transaminase